MRSLIRLVPYNPALTRVFLANEGLADQAKSLLADRLDISEIRCPACGGLC
jgi:hypothetical protein